MVITIGIAVGLSAVTTGWLYYVFGFPMAYAGFAFLGLIGFTSLAPVFFKKDPGPIEMDERDQQILFKAHRVSMMLSYMVFGALCMGIWAVYYYSKTETISVHVLPLVYGAAGITAFFSNALMTLILYGRHNICEGETK